MGPSCVRQRPAMFTESRAQCSGRWPVSSRRALAMRRRRSDGKLTIANYRIWPVVQPEESDDPFRRRTEVRLRLTPVIQGF